MLSNVVLWPQAALWRSFEAMTKTSVQFEMGNYEWVSERESVGFLGMTDLGEVPFLITSDALCEMLNPELDGIDSETALETFMEFEADIHRIARREFVKRLGGEPPILITSADLE
ncbi:DUF1488 family protein [Sphingobium yanoikuyae]|jgi:hypothetical protein|uniref:DUF1488 family protein n=1 Tax=Sphingobium yanoikuyae TaxID=13690 RepID=UPI0013783B02|nr:DUF1488 family protein [Sphingobium yanoikuyae]